MQLVDHGFAPLSKYRRPSRRVYVISYDPDMLERMGVAFDMAWQKLSGVVAGNERNRRNLARFVFLHVDRGERDPDRLSDLAAADYQRRFSPKVLTW